MRNGGRISWESSAGGKGNRTFVWASVLLGDFGDDLAGVEIGICHLCSCGCDSSPLRDGGSEYGSGE